MFLASDTLMDYSMFKMYVIFLVAMNLQSHIQMLSHTQQNMDILKFNLKCNHIETSNVSKRSSFKLIVAELHEKEQKIVRYNSMAVCSSAFYCYLFYC